MKKILFLLLFTVSIYGQTYQNPTYGTVTEKSNSTDNTPAYFITTQVDGVHKKTPAALIALKSDLPASYAVIVYVNATNPNSATIFDDVNPPTTNDNAFKADVDNLYIGTDASTWVYNGSTYVTKTIPASSNFKIVGTGVDAGSNKTSSIYREGAISSDGSIGSNIGYYVNRNGSNTAQIGGFTNYSNAIGSNSMMFQLNGSNGLDLWNYASSTWNKRFTFSSSGYLTANSFIKLGGTSSQFLMADGSVSLGGTIDATPTDGSTNAVQSNGVFDALALKANQDGTILYHSVKWFTPSSTVSNVGATVTSIGTQFTSAMVGAKLIIEGEQRIITAYTSSTVVTVNSAYSTNYSGVVAGSWGVYSIAVQVVSDGNIRFYSTIGGTRYTAYLDQYMGFYNEAVTILNVAQFNSTGGVFSGNKPIRWNNATNSLVGTVDLGLRRNAAGVLEIYDGITATGLDANRRDLMVRKLLVNTSTDNGVDQIQAAGTISATSYTGSATLTGTPTAPTATVGTNTTQIATTAFVQENVGANTYWTKTGNNIANNNSGIVTAAGMRFGNIGGNVFADFNRYGQDISFILGNPGFQTTDIAINNATGGVLSSTSKLFLTANGVSSIEVESTNVKLNVPIRLKNYTVATLPTGTQGDTAIVTDALAPTYMTTVVGGGAVVTPVFYNGTSWVAH